MFFPELLAPAGSPEKLKVAIAYGADAVYLSGQRFGLRSAADNFTATELEEGIRFAHQSGVKTYVTLNSFFHDSDFQGLDEFVQYLEGLEADALIISDLGVISYLNGKTKIPLHLSTQASCLNLDSALFWREMGVKRLILGREVSIEEAGKIKRGSGLEVELFIHGSMCMSYSGNCTISNLTSGRDSNRGGCAHSCRFEYSLDFPNEIEEGSDKKTRVNSSFMSSKDLAGIDLLPEFSRHEINSVKIEGRMKGPHYTATVVKNYREAIDLFKKQGEFKSRDLTLFSHEFSKVSHRDYTHAGLLAPAQAESIYQGREQENSSHIICAIIIEVKEADFLLLEVRSSFKQGEELEILTFSGDNISFASDKILTLDNQQVEKTKPGTLVKVAYQSGCLPLHMIRKKNPEFFPVNTQGGC